MHRLLFLRPVSRALRAPRPSTRAFTASACQNFRVTGPVNKRNRMSEVDSELFGIEEETPKEKKQEDDSPVESRKRKQEDPVPAPSRTKAEDTGTIAPQPFETVEAQNPFADLASEFDETSTIQAELQQEFGDTSATVIDAFGPIPSEGPLDVEQYISSWFSEETNDILLTLRASRYGFMAASVETPYIVNFLNNLNEADQKEFEKHWLTFEMSDKEDDTGLIPVAEFFLRRGIQLLPPTLACPFPEDCVRTLEPSIVEEAFKGEPGAWLSKGKEIQRFRAAEIPYPNLMEKDALLDPRDVIEFPPDELSPHHNRVIIRNHRSVFHDYQEGNDLFAEEAEEEEGGSRVSTEESDEANDSILKSIPVSGRYYQNLYHSILMRRSVVQQTGKGKIRRISYMVLVGDGNGLVGYGEGKHSNSGVALKAAKIAAVKNMDWVERFEKRTIWTEMNTKLGATQIILRPRPVGFGLRCNPFIHQIMRAAGFKDISAKVWGSRNKLNVIKALFRMLHAGHAPTGMGDGVGGKGKKLSKGAGIRGKAEIERARGRKLINLRN